MAALRLLVSDVDGTLVTTAKELTPAAVDAVRALRDAGVAVVLVSSRPPGGFASLFKSLSVDPASPLAAAAFNGGALLDGRLDALSFDPLDPADAKAALETFDALGVTAWVFTLDQWRIRDPHGPHVDHEQHTIGFAPTVVERFDDLQGIGKIVGASDDAGLLDRAAAALSTKLSADAAAVRSQSYYLDVMHARANKGAALRAIADRLGFEIAQVAAIGDMANDVPMLEIAGFAVAMGNAPDAVKALADAVTAGNDDDGFARAAHDLLLPRATKGS